MILKDWGVPWNLYKLTALEGRTPSHHHMKENIKKDLNKKRRQIKGEKQIGFPLSFLDEKEYKILHNIRLKDQNGHFQMDTLLLCLRYILILEIKNWYGTVLFGENGQVTRIGDDGKEEGFSNPVPQAMLQKQRLQKWLRLHSNLNIPILYFVVISFPSTIIKSISPYKIPEGVIHNNQLIFNIMDINQIYTREQTSENKIHSTSQKLIKAHTPKTLHAMDQYNISKNELIKGVVCPNCASIPMIRRKKQWFCNQCGCYSSDAHLRALNDYKLLLNDYISNREAREFLQIESPYVTKGLLQKENFPTIGERKNRKYKLHFKDTKNLTS